MSALHLPVSGEPLFEWAESHYSRPHWARATTKTPVKIGDVQEPVVALVDQGSEINLMSMDFYKKGKWPINTKHGWKIRCREDFRPQAETRGRRANWRSGRHIKGIGEAPSCKVLPSLVYKR